MIAEDKVLIDYDPERRLCHDGTMVIYDNGEYTCVWQTDTIKPLRKDYTWHPTPEAARLAAQIRGRQKFSSGHNDFNPLKQRNSQGKVLKYSNDGDVMFTAKTYTHKAYP